MQTPETLQPIVYRQLHNSFETDRLSHAYLFEGDKGTGKQQTAIWLAQLFFCTSPVAGNPCGTCNNCTRIAAGEHPDVIQVRPEGQTIKVEQIRFLQSEFAKSGFEKNRKVLILEDAEKMTGNSANGLLKFLEEPPKGFLAILQTSAISRILPTIQSRCQVLHFQMLSKKRLIEKLVAEQIAPETAELLAELTNSFEKAVEILHEEWFNDAKEAVQKWSQYLLNHDAQAFIYVQKRLTKVVKDRAQQEVLLQMLSFYVRKQRPNTKEQLLATNLLLERILDASKKLSANVPFQGVAEQLALRTVL